MIGRLILQFKWLLSAGLTLAILLGVLYATLPPHTFYKAANVISMAMMAAMILFMLKKFRKERPFSRLPQYIAMITPVVTLTIYLYLYSEQARIYFMMMVPAFLAGLIVGIWQSRATRLYLKEGRVFGQNSGWWLAFWGTSFMATQLLVILRKQQAFHASLVVQALTTGIAVGTAWGLLKGIVTVRGQEASSGAAPVDQVSSGPVSWEKGGFCPYCGQPADHSDRFCEYCGQSVRE